MLNIADVKAALAVQYQESDVNEFIQEYEELKGLAEEMTHIIKFIKLAADVAATMERKGDKT